MVGEFSCLRYSFSLSALQVLGIELVLVYELGSARATRGRVRRARVERARVERARVGRARVGRVRVRPPTRYPTLPFLPSALQPGNELRLALVSVANLP